MTDDWRLPSLYTVLPHPRTLNERPHLYDEVTDVEKIVHAAGADLRTAYTRREGEMVSSDDPRTWKQSMEHTHEHGLAGFDSARSAIRRRAKRLCTIVSKELSIAYKLGDPFPAHFVWEDHAYYLIQPEVLNSATKSQRKNKAFLEGILSTIVANHEWDRFATLVIGLTVAQKVVTPWFEVDEDDE